MDLIRTHSLTQLEQDTAKGNSAFHERLKRGNNDSYFYKLAMIKVIAAREMVFHYNSVVTI